MGGVLIVCLYLVWFFFCLRECGIWVFCGFFEFVVGDIWVVDFVLVGVRVVLDFEVFFWREGERVCGCWGYFFWMGCGCVWNWVLCFVLYWFF